MTEDRECRRQTECAFCTGPCVHGIGSRDHQSTVLADFADGPEGDDEQVVIDDTDVADVHELFAPDDEGDELDDES